MDYEVRQARGSGGVRGKSKVYYAELERLHKAGRLTPKNVLKEARSARSPLHDAIDWNDRDAAEKWRLNQARSLIGSFVLVWRDTPDSEPKEIRAFHRVDMGEKDGHYAPVQTILESRDLSLAVVRRALDEAESWRARYERFVEFFEPAFHGIGESARRVSGEIEARTANAKGKDRSKTKGKAKERTKTKA